MQWDIIFGSIVQKDYAYQVSGEELELMVSQNATPSKKQFGSVNPWVFTETMKMEK